MAGTQIGTRPTKVGDVIQSEYGLENGYARETVSVLLSSDSSIGDVLYDNSGTYELVDVANTASASAINVDPETYNNLPDSGTVSVDLAVLVRGPSVVGDANLNYASDVDTDAEKTAVNDVLEAAGIVVREQI